MGADVEVSQTRCASIRGNVVLHYVLDLWVHQWRQRHARGKVIIVRYADDFVMGFQYETDAQRMAKAVEERLAKSA